MENLPATPAPSKRSGCLLYAGGALAVIFALVAGGSYWWQERQAQRAADQETAAAEAFAPAIAKLEAGGGDFDIDRTVRVLHQIDEAMRHQDDLHAFLAEVAKEDWRGVPQDVLAARKQILDVQLKLYGKQLEQEEQKAMWSLSRDIVLTTLSVVSVSGEGGMVPDAQFKVDSEAAQSRLAELRAQEASRRALVREVDALEGELIEASMAYATVWAKYMEQYDRLSLMRDRAWMAARREDWGEVEREAARAAIFAPHDREAHLLLARARLEARSEEGYESVDRLLGSYMEEHPDAAAPALLLRGYRKELSGDMGGAAADYEHASQAYPKQASQLDDVLDPYRMRAELRKSRAGAGIVESYSSTMVGAGWYSPELHMARLAFGRGDRDSGKAQVVQHFERRRAQGQWDYILADLLWAESVLGDDFRSIFPEEDWLDLRAEKTLLGMGEKLGLGIENRSGRPLKNAALVLCVRFTDMLSGDYVTFAGERTVPEVAAKGATDFGAVDLDTEVFGKVRTEDDIVEMRAILVTDDGVLWVDTEKYKADRLAQAKADRARDPRSSTEQGKWQAMVEDAGRTASVSREKGMVQDALAIQLPAKLVWLRPKFTLKYGSAVLEADTNVVEGDKIMLRFDGIGSLLDPNAPARAADLVCDSVFGTFTLSFGPTPEGGWRYLGAKAE